MGNCKALHLNFYTMNKNKKAAEMQFESFAEFCRHGNIPQYLHDNRPFSNLPGVVYQPTNPNGEKRLYVYYGDFVVQWVQSAETYDGIPMTVSIELKGEIIRKESFFLKLRYHNSEELFDECVADFKIKQEDFGVFADVEFNELQMLGRLFEMCLKLQTSKNAYVNSFIENPFSFRFEFGKEAINWSPTFWRSVSNDGCYATLRYSIDGEPIKEFEYQPKHFYEQKYNID